MSVAGPSAGLTGISFLVVDPDHDAGRIDGVHHTAALGDHGNAGVHRHFALHSGTNQRLFRFQRRHGLALHVGAHECPIGVVVFKKRNQRRRHRNNLPRRDVHVVHFVGRRQGELVLVPAGHQVVG
jgi:hypothetical protein